MILKHLQSAGVFFDIAFQKEGRNGDPLKSLDQEECEDQGRVRIVSPCGIEVAADDLRKGP